MASVIKAGNATDGIQVTADNTGILELKTGTGSGTTALTLSSSQNATIAGTLQVAGVSTNMYPLVSGTAQTAPFASPNTSAEFTGIPSWAKRITLMCNGVSTNGTSNYQIQIGSGSFTTSGYASGCSYSGASPGGAALTSGFLVSLLPNAGSLHSGIIIITNVNGNNWVCSSNLYYGNASTYVLIGAGNAPTLGGSLDRVRLTTTGTDTFDAGTINIMWE